MKQVLVVGGSGGLGTAIVRELIDRKLAPVVAGRSKCPDSRVRYSYVIDASVQDWGSFYVDIEKHTGSPIDAVVFVSGVGAFGQTSLFPQERARAMFELNFWACTTAAVRIAEHWSSRGRAGTFVGVLSLAARLAVPFEAYYAASKTAADRFLQCLDLEYTSKGIRFLSALPGVLNTPFRERAEWYGIEPSMTGQGTDVGMAARAIGKLLRGGRRARIIGWRERIIGFADRVAPGLYDYAILRRRVLRLQRQKSRAQETLNWM
jgi:short-subunit dehydrogenase